MAPIQQALVGPGNLPLAPPDDSTAQQVLGIPGLKQKLWVRGGRGGEWGYVIFV